MKLLKQDKKGVSEIVSYVVLIVIAIGVSILVFMFLSPYISSGKEPVCPEQVSLDLREISCNSSKILNVTLVNNGFLMVDAAYIRVSEQGRRLKDWINQDDSNFYIYLQPQSSEKITGLNLGSYTSTTDFEIEITPAFFDTKIKKLASCSHAIISQPFSCS